MSDDPSLRGPALRAALVAEAVIPLHDPVRLLKGGFLAAPCTHEVLFLEPELRVVSQFPIPEDRTHRYSLAGGGLRIDVSPDHQWVVLAGTDRMVVVDPTGQVAWRTAYPVFRDAAGDTVPACGVFSLDGSELWAFVPTLGASSGEDWVDAERWVVRTSDWQVTARAESRYRGTTHIAVHPDGEQLGYADLDGHGADGSWTTWQDNVESAPIRGDWIPLDVSPDGHRWLGVISYDVVVGDFTGTRIELNEDGRWDHWRFNFCGCFVTPLQVLVAVSHDDGREHRHLLFRADTLEQVGHVAYPPAFPSEQENGFVLGYGDGTWLTTDTEGIRRWAFVEPTGT
ncbi:hypothetical protein [Embleya sp. NPDC001921]